MEFFRGAERASSVAEPKVQEVKRRVGFIIPTAQHGR
jgi:hypothetical protein